MLCVTFALYFTGYLRGIETEKGTEVWLEWGDDEWGSKEKPNEPQLGYISIAITTVFTTIISFFLGKLLNFIWDKYISKNQDTIILYRQ